MPEKILEPRVDALISSLRSVGYSLNTAVADIIDNSISAHAKKIYLYVQQEANKLPFFVCIDDGDGMTADQLYEAMRLGSHSPDDQRSETDLGRFGLGLKTASFAMCKKFTLLSAINGNVCAASWDIDEVKRQQAWKLKKKKKEEYIHLPLFEKMPETGTMLVWHQIDRLASQQTSNFNKELIKLKNHLELTFHRYLAGDATVKIDIYLNGRSLKAFDPFRVDSYATQSLDIEKIQIGEGEEDCITITPYILPSRWKCSSEDDYKKYAGDGGYLANQGIYVYRNKRLISHGSWFRLAQIDNAYQLARVKIDIPNFVDNEWQVDFKKSTVKLPEKVKNRLKKIIGEITNRAAMTYRSCGSMVSSNNHTNKEDNKNFWKLYISDKEKFFRINRENYLIRLIGNNLSEQDSLIFEHLLRLIEEDLKQNQSLLLSNLSNNNLSDIENEESKSREELIEEGVALYQDMLEIINSAQATLDYIMELECFASVKDDLYARIKDRH